MPIIFDRVTKVIGKHKVIDQVSCTMQTGNITGLKGINGSGKTMMMRLIAGLIYPTEGQVIVDGKSVGKEISFPPSLGIMLENPSFLNPYSGYENLKLLAGIKAYKKYSLGMTQRLGIAAAIMERPAILLLDEPTNSLDESGVALVKQIVQEEKARGATVVLSCHDASILADLADEIIAIQGGKIAEA